MVMLLLGYELPMKTKDACTVWFKNNNIEFDKSKLVYDDEQ